MKNEIEENAACDACGYSAEVGFIIKEGDHVAEVSLFANNKAQLEDEFAKYVALAKEVYSDVNIEIEPMNDDSKELHARLAFSCSAEKLIYDLKTRTLTR